MGYVKDAIIGTGALIGSYISETEAAQYLTGIDSELGAAAGNMDHFFAGLGAPFLFDLVTKPLQKYVDIPNCAKFLNYAILAAYWETKQLIERGYFQFDQFMLDVAGLGTAYVIDKLTTKENDLMDGMDCLGSEEPVDIFDDELIKEAA